MADAMATIELAAAVDAMFVRGTFSGVYVGDGGLYDNDFSSVLRRKASLRLDELKMLYSINPETDRNLDGRPVAEIAKSVASKATPDGLCVSGQPAGDFAVDDELIKSVKANVSENVAVICNTGCRVDTVARKLAISDAAIVATAFKKNGDFHKFIDKSRVSEFMNAVREYRKTIG
jgi:membrane complex biogenesis BtpA family protein